MVLDRARRLGQTCGMGFSAGFAHFFNALGRLMTMPEARSLYFKQLARALSFGIMFWVLTTVLLGVGLWFLFTRYQGYIPWMWVEAATGVGLVVVWLFLAYFSTGPITLIIVSLYLSEVTAWDELAKKFELELPVVQEPHFLSSVPRVVGRTLFLLLVICVGVLLGLVPLLLFVPPLCAAYALGKDWVWTTRDLFPSAAATRKNRPSDWAYCVGLGLVPSLMSSIPILGLFTLPILQVASLIRYEEHTKVDR